MWNDLPPNKKEKYKRMILAFASLSEMFAQKSETASDYAKTETMLPAPIVNSKFQETVFQKSFGASAEDIGNTSFDASLKIKDENGILHMYLIGIKTFGIHAGAQKIAQFKANNRTFNHLVQQIEENSKKADGTWKTKDEINSINKNIYYELVRIISLIRNERIRSSIANIKGFVIPDSDRTELVYHVLMPSKSGETPTISVGETSYCEIAIENITNIQCTSNAHPANITFEDGIHKYKFTPADCQLYMEFQNNEIIQDTWNVQYVDDAFQYFSNLADEIYGTQTKPAEPIITESFSWKINIEPYSGYNSFYGIGLLKQGKKQRADTISSFGRKFDGSVNTHTLRTVLDLLAKIADSSSPQIRERLRDKIMREIRLEENEEFYTAAIKLLYRPVDEIYIPIPRAREFHAAYPNFFAPNAGILQPNTAKLVLPKEQRAFNLIFEPSGNSVRSFITQDFGKAIQSYEKQSILGRWILREVFQLEEYEPLTEEKLLKVGINGIRLYKDNLSNDVHLKFIWIDNDNLPVDYIA